MSTDSSNPGKPLNWKGKGRATQSEESFELITTEEPLSYDIGESSKPIPEKKQSILSGKSEENSNLRKSISFANLPRPPRKSSEKPRESSMRRASSDLKWPDEPSNSGILGSIGGSSFDLKRTEEPLSYETEQSSNSEKSLRKSRSFDSRTTEKSSSSTLKTVSSIFGKLIPKRGMSIESSLEGETQDSAVLQSMISRMERFSTESPVHTRCVSMLDPTPEQ